MAESRVAKRLATIEREGGDGEVALGKGARISLTNLGKTYFQEIGRTKGDLMRYYERVAPHLLPTIAGRPLVLKRFPDGVEGKSFFQQNAPADAPPSVRVETVPAEDAPARRLVGGDLATLLYGVQLGTIDVNPWHSRIESLTFPDYTILDLDPGPRSAFATIVRVAAWLKELLDDAGIRAGLKTSGSRGLHIVIPVPADTNEEAAQLVAQILAQRVSAEHPAEATVVRSRAARPPAAVYVDYLQNIVGKSVAAALSVRARPAATISAPLDWSELTSALDPAAFTMDTDPNDLAERGRLWVRAMRARNSLDGIVSRRLA